MSTITVQTLGLEDLIITRNGEGICVRLLVLIDKIALIIERLRRLIPHFVMKRNILSRHTCSSGRCTFLNSSISSLGTLGTNDTRILYLRRRWKI